MVYPQHVDTIRIVYEVPATKMHFRTMECSVLKDAWEYVNNIRRNSQSKTYDRPTSIFRLRHKQQMHTHKEKNMNKGNKIR